MSSLKNTTFSFAVSALLLIFNSSYSQSRTEKIRAYIARHKELAIEQMVKFGIPASVTLAQAIKESDFGTSELAKYANNHFSIKCHVEWGGRNYLLDDDESDECFRSYNSVEESFLDHSMFLVSRPRYDFLFNYKASDHYNWCVGLKKAGYATAWNYADELLLIIAAFDLDKLDKPEALAIRNVFEDLLPQSEKNIVVSTENYFATAEKAILAKVIFNQEPAAEQPLLVRRNEAEHAE
jgi:flagellum-specific peptidoglycan hydrolase FlgJ